MNKTEDILEAFASIEKWNLKPETIICTVCGNIFSVRDKDISLCQHLKELFAEVAQWVEHDLPKVGAADSSSVLRSKL